MRVRRTAAASRDAILDAAERRLVEGGPQGLRLTEVAADVGIAHPTVLHHFGSREKLIDAVLERRIAAMNELVLRFVAIGPSDPSRVRELFEGLAIAFGPLGHARTIAYLALSGHAAPGLEGVRPLAEAVEEARRAAGARAPDDPRDTYFTVLLVAFALFGDALVGPLFRGLPEKAPAGASPEAFRAWLADLLRARLFSEPNANEVAQRERVV